MILYEIANRTRQRVESAKKCKSMAQMIAEAEALPSDTGFLFENSLKKDNISFICEVKKASPSKGIIAEDFPYLNIAKDYEAAGACAISVLTEPDYFKGCDQYLREIVQSVRIPVLRKDFTIDAYQVYEAKCLGASAILLICALLDTDTLKEYIEIAHKLGMSALVEAHDKAEVQSALEAGAKIIGVNNRNLKDFNVDINNSIRLRSLVPDHIPFIAESGIQTADDILALYQAKVNGVLIGETLMRSPDKKATLHVLRGKINV